MKIVITGGAGYIGSILVEELLKLNFDVGVIDIFEFGLHSLKSSINNPKLKIYIKDIRDDMEFEFLQDYDIMIHLAGIVGDPACASNANLAIDININGTENILNQSKKYGIKHFIFASSCSVYGSNIKPEILLDEKSKLNPLSLYAETKVKGEEIINNFDLNDMKVTIFRFGTLFGLSNRPRFDLVINFLTGKLYHEKNGKIFGGQQWRPFVHVRDVVNAIILGLNQENKDKINLFNVGSNELNLQMKDLIPIYEKNLDDINLILDESIVDYRNYRVSFNKIKEILNFNAEFTIDDGINEMINAFADYSIKDYRNKLFRNYLQNE